MASSRSRRSTVPSSGRSTVEMPEYYRAKRSIDRFSPDCDVEELDEVKRYFHNRAVEMAGTLCHLNDKFTCFDWGVQATFSGDFEKLKEEGHVVNSNLPLSQANMSNAISVYIFKSARGKGHMSKFVDECVEDKVIIITSPDCQIESFLKAKGAYFVVVKPKWHNWEEYKLISEYYGDKVTDRTGLHMMNHIDEGMFILRKFGANEDEQRAYIMHPLVQGDEDLQTFWNNPSNMQLISNQVLTLALEYRNIANAHLSFHPSGQDAFKLSPIPGVNMMLIADKIQNRKDFELYHSETHLRRDKLTVYFKEWLLKLGISEASYDEVSRELIENTGGLELAKLMKQPSEFEIDMSKQPGFLQVAEVTQQATKDQLSDSLTEKGEMIKKLLFCFSAGLAFGVVGSVLGKLKK